MRKATMWRMQPLGRPVFLQFPEIRRLACKFLSSVPKAAGFYNIHTRRRCASSSSSSSSFSSSLSSSSSSSFSYVLTKEELEGIPEPYVFHGRIAVCSSPAQVNRLLLPLMREKILGIDTESKPWKNPTGRIATLQLSSNDYAVVLRIHDWEPGLLACSTASSPGSEAPAALLKQLLEDKTVIKAGQVGRKRGSALF